MRQWYGIKEAHPDCLIFFRLGDFYELFYDDAETAAPILNITLTSRDQGAEGRVPMCGVPFHAYESYAARLLERGFKVALCEQMEAPGKGLVDRQVVRILTPGTGVAGEREGEEAYLATALPLGGKRAALALADVATGAFFVGEVESLEEELSLWPVAELLVPPPGTLAQELSFEGVITSYEPEGPLPSFPGEERLDPPLKEACRLLVAYVQHAWKSYPHHLQAPEPLHQGRELYLDRETRVHLEIFQRLDGRTEGTLFWALDRTVTRGGGRVLRRWLSTPLRRRGPLEERLDAVGYWQEHHALRRRLRQTLKETFDLERILARLAAGKGTPRDLQALGDTLERALALKDLLEREEAFSPLPPLLEEAANRLARTPATLRRRLAEALNRPAPSDRRKGGFIRDGYDADLDGWRHLMRHGHEMLLELEKREREATNIRSLKVGFNKVFGYYIEVTHTHREGVPPHYIRKQTLAQAERYITPELKELEEKLLHAEEAALAREEDLFGRLVEQVRQELPALMALAQALHLLDVTAALGELAAERGYRRPELVEEPILEATAARHPVLEQILGGEVCVPNEISMTREKPFLLLTGPNMAGKSTYARTAALLCLLAQVGSFVPAAFARIGLADAIFTRIGARDDLAGGESTFMREMLETRRILERATSASLVVVDEVGRGTSTYDGLALAGAVAEELVGRRCRTLFTTHFHELTELEEQNPAVKNLTMAVAEDREKGSLRFLYSVQEGAADRSYGLHVAALAGLSPRLLARARSILKRLEEKEGEAPQVEAPPQEGLLEAWRRELLALSLDDVSPREAWELLALWQERLQEREESPYG
ncbi:MAG: DNA mismatch repair protein MutS [Bacillota bacterium]|nr:DNA mismatch repair protein MutS [Bacillota bacterium]